MFPHGRTGSSRSICARHPEIWVDTFQQRHGLRGRRTVARLTALHSAGCAWIDKDQAPRAHLLQALHAGGAFVIANAWDGGSARILGSLGFPALATSSGAAAGALGRLDHGISLDESLANARLICDSTDLPVSADLEKGFGDAPADAARAITRAAEVGLVGGSIEDATGRRDAPIFDLGLATERMAAAVEAARALPFPFTLTAAPRTSSMAATISTTPSAACRPMNAPARMCCSRRRCRTWPRCAPCARR